MIDFYHQCMQMGSRFSYGITAGNQELARSFLDAGVNETDRIEKLLSEFQNDSDTSRINAEAHIRPVRVRHETFSLIKRCIAISRLTAGDFDITAGVLKSLYPFKNNIPSLPTSSAIQQALDKVGYQKLILDEKELTIRFKRPGMKISFAAVGKGYASDRVKRLWNKMGSQSGFVNASGDLNAFGRRADNSHWKTAIANPENPGKMLCYIDLEHTAAATSGDYEQYFEINGRRFSHSINPHTALPVSSLSSATVISPSAELSDALATAVSVRGAAKGTEFINQLPDTHSICFDKTSGLILSKNMRYEAVAV